jgi:hypothetical protein
MMDCRVKPGNDSFAIHSSRRPSSDGLLRGVYHRAALCADPLARNDGCLGCLKLESVQFIECECATRPTVIAREGGRSSIPRRS